MFYLIAALCGAVLGAALFFAGFLAALYTVKSEVPPRLPSLPVKGKSMALDKADYSDEE